jgi:hypothetical protein
MQPYFASAATLEQRRQMKEVVLFQQLIYDFGDNINLYMYCSATVKRYFPIPTGHDDAFLFPTIKPDITKGRLN